MTKRAAKIEALHALADISDSRATDRSGTHAEKVQDAYRSLERELRKKAIALHRTEEKRLQKSKP